MLSYGKFNGFRRRRRKRPTYLPLQYDHNHKRFLGIWRWASHWFWHGWGTPSQPVELIKQLSHPLDYSHEWRSSRHLNGNLESRPRMLSYSPCLLIEIHFKQLFWDQEIQDFKEKYYIYSEQYKCFTMFCLRIPKQFDHGT